MARHISRQHQQQVQRCSVCALFQRTGGQYRSVYDRVVYLQHVQTAHPDRPQEERGRQLTKSELHQEDDN